MLAQEFEDLEKGEKRMSKKSEKFENEIVEMVNHHIGERLPLELPEWMAKQGVVPGAVILGAEGIGSKGHENKTDVIVRCDKGSPLKISAKLRNADYFGNWYGHERFVEEFGISTFQRLTSACTNWANGWMKTAKAPFVGVSVSFGKRSGRTQQSFLDIFEEKDILTVVAGYGDGDNVANCLYVGDHCVNSIVELLDCLLEISEENVRQLCEDFKIIYRPVNPMTEDSNRGKNVYTFFRPYEKYEKPTIFDDTGFFILGRFETVNLEFQRRLNHNKVLDYLEGENIYIPRKRKSANGK